MFEYNLSSKHRALLAIIFTVSLSALIVFTASSRTNTNKEEVTNFVTEKMTECKTTSNDLCYKNIAHIFISKYNIHDVLQVFEENEKKSTFFSDCHTELHFLGQEEYKKLKNTSKALAAGTPVCFAGFYHGVLEQYLGDNNIFDNNGKLEEVVPNLCGQEGDFSVKKIYNECLHGLGHALMYATDSDLPRSLELCDKLKSGSDRNWCYSGVFMENSTSSTNKDHPSKYLKPSDPMYPCDAISSKYGNMCYMLQSFYFAEITHYDWKQNESWCKKIPEEFQDQCFNAIGQTQVGYTQDPNIMRNNCNLMSDKKNVTNCLDGVIGGLGERYSDGWSKVLSFCKDTLSGDDKNNCYNLAIELSKTWINDSKTLKSFCEQIDSDFYKNQCLKSI